MIERRKDKRTSRLSVVISLVFHGLIIGALVFIAAREGILGKDLKKIAVTMVPREKPPEKPKEKPPEPKPEVETPKTETPQPVITTPPPEVPKVTAAPPSATLPPAAAPAPVAIPAFDFEGGKAVDTTSDPHVIYKGFIEYTLRSRWSRPDAVADDN